MMTNRLIRVAAVQPRCVWGDGEWQNAWQCVRLIDEAAASGARLITFPEAYPGPGHGPMDSGGHLPASPIEMVRERAARHRVYVAASCLDRVPDRPDAYWLTLKLIGPDGAILANYKRVQPDTHYLNEYLHGGRMHVLPGDEIMVVPTELGRIGLQICSELFVPELSRIQMLRGAEIIIAPVNGQHSETKPQVAETWRCVARARAAENLCYVLATQNVFRDETRGVGIIAGPERALATTDGAGILLADLDLDRLAYFRCAHYGRGHFTPPTPEEPATGCRPGQIHERRPELYGALVAPQEDAFDYFTYGKGPDAVAREHARVRDYYYPRVADRAPVGGEPAGLKGGGR